MVQGSKDKYRSWADPLLRIIVGTASLLAALFAVLIIYWGAGPVLFETPWYIPTMHSFTGLAAFCVAYLALGRYQVLRDPAAYWIGIAFAAFGLESIFFILAWPGLLPGGHGLIAQLPNTSGWIALLELSSLNLFLLAALLGNWPGEPALTGRRWLGSVAAWLGLVILIASLSVRFEAYLPQLVGPQGNLTPLLLSCDWLFMVLFAVGTVLSTRRYMRSGDTLLGYVAITQITLAFVVLTALIGARRYDLWYYLSRIILVGGFLTMLFGLLSEYVDLFRRERDKSREVQDREQKLRTLFELLPVGISVLDGDGQVVEANPALQRLLGLTDRELATGLYRRRQYLRSDGTQLPLNELPAAVARQENRVLANVEVGIVKESGETIWTAISAVPVPLADWRVVSAVIDISPRKRAETALQRSEAILAQASQMAHLGVWEIEFSNAEDVNANPLRWSDEVYRIFGYQPGEVEVSNDLFFERVHPDDRPRVAETVRQALATGEPYQFEHRVIRPDGTERTVLEHAEITFDSQGRPRRILGAVQDITARKQAEQQVSQLSRLYATLSQVNQTIVRVKDPLELYQTICHVAVEYGQFSRAWIGLLDGATGAIQPVASAGAEADQRLSQPIDLQTAPFKDGPLTTAIRTGQVATREDDYVEAAVPFRLRGQTVGVLTLQAWEAGFFAAAEEVRLLGEMGLDISHALDRLATEAERQQAEADLRQSEERFAKAFQSSPAAAVISQADGLFVDANESFLRLFGYDRVELIGHRSLDLHLFANPGERAHLMDRLHTTGSVRDYELSVRKKSGELRQVLFSIEIITLNGVPHNLKTFVDITERQQAEAAAARAAERVARLQRVTAALSGAVTPTQVAEVIMSQAGPVLGAGGGWVFQLTPDGQALETIATVGYPAELVERWRRVPLTADMPIVEAIRLNRLLVIGSSERLSTQFARVTPYPTLTGSRVVVPMEVHGQVVGGLSFTFAEAREFSPADQEFMQTLAGQCAQALERARLYEHSQAELAARRQAEERLTLSLQEKEVLLREVHHRVRNNLQAIFNLLTLQAGYVKDPAAREMFLDIQSRIKSIALVHEKLYQTGNLAELNFAEYLTSLAHYLLQTYGAQPEQIRLHIESNVDKLDLDTAVPLGIIINELVSNALQYAFPEGGPGEIRVEVRAEAAQQLELTVSDNGVGLPEEVNLAVPNTLGLQLVSLLTDHMRGKLEFDDANGGTTIKIRLTPAWLGSNS